MMKSELFLKKLREQTLPHQRAMEEMSYSNILLSHEITIGHYTLFLKKLYGFVFSFEKNVFPFMTSELPDLRLRKKAQLLQDDFLMGHASGQEVPLIDDRVFSSIYTTAAKAWGGMYVMEGSTLVGQGIHHHLQKRLSHSFKGSAYFTSYGNQTGPMWTTFLKKFSEQAITHEREEEIIYSAIQTFHIIETWMNNSYQN